MSAGPHVVVVGAGVAGTAAALAAASSGASVTIVDGGTGASTLSTGAIDLVPWHLADGPRPAPTQELRAMVDALGAYRLPDGGSRVLTTAGLVRPAAGHDSALLDVAAIPKGRIGVVRCGRPAWDARCLARAWGDRFEPVEVPALRLADEHVIPDADFAARHDDQERLGWLSERLRDALARAGGTFAGIVLPAALGLEYPRAHALSTLVGVRCGEASGLPGGPSGLRFERARDRTLLAAGVKKLVAVATTVERKDLRGPSAARWRVTTRAGGALDADAVVLAPGGLLGGGIEYSPSETMLASVLPPRARPPFRLTIEAPLALGSRGRPLDLPGSLFGVAPESLAWPFVDDPLVCRVGVLVAVDGAAEAVGVYAAGEIVADAPRTWLGSLASGIRAGASAARANVASIYGEGSRRSTA
jgi:glycerol-3-phosphate dehydrogenase subunit B